MPVRRRRPRLARASLFSNLLIRRPRQKVCGPAHHPPPINPLPLHTPPQPRTTLLSTLARNRHRGARRSSRRGRPVFRSHRDYLPPRQRRPRRRPRRCDRATTTTTRPPPNGVHPPPTTDDAARTPHQSAVSRSVYVVVARLLCALAHAKRIIIIIISRRYIPYIPIYYI